MAVAPASQTAAAAGELAAPTITTTGSELLKNGSFESASLPPTHFSAESAVNRVRGTAISGSTYGRIASTTSAIVPVGLVTRPAVTGLTPGTSVVASCYVRSNATYSAILRVSEVSGSTKRVKERASTTSLTWRPVTITYTVSLASSSLFLAVYSTGPTTTNKGGLGVDGCSMKRVSGALPSIAAAPSLPTSAPSGFTRRFSESFNTPAGLGSFDNVYGSRFSEYLGCCTTNRRTQYSSGKVLSAKNGSLYYYLHSENGQSYAAAPVPGKYLNFTYGQFGVSARLVSSIGDGYKLAFLLWPQNDTWTNEVDFPEVYPDFSQNVYATSLKTTTTTGAHLFSGGPSSPTAMTLADNRYHTFLLDWRPGKITAYADGQIVSTFTGSAVPTQPMHVVLQTEGWKDHGDVPAASNATVEVPWVYVNSYG